MTKIRFFAAAFFTVAAAVAVIGQTENAKSPVGHRYVISAKAGAVNFVEGDVTVITVNGRGNLLIKGDSLEIGDKVSTGANGKAEILLNPGSYLRVGANSQFEFITTSLEDLQLRIDSGSAILEVFATEDFRVTVIVPNGEFALIKTGVYRIDAEGGKGTLAVWKGRALLTDEETGETIIKGGREAAIEGEDVTVAKFDRDDKDELDRWSKTRARELSRITSSLERKEIRSSLLNSFYGGGWNTYDSFGLWVYDQRRGYAGFLPFGYDWVSGYGHWFRNSLGWYNMPSYVYYAPSVRQYPGTTFGATNTTGTAGTSGTTTTRTGGTATTSSPRTRSTGGRVMPGRASAAPPFSRMPGGSSPSGVSGGRSFPSDRGFPSGSSAPVSRPSAPLFSPAPSVPVSAGSSRMRTKGDN